ncbi:hypothetical protein C8Q74DRAFT_1222904 [Fomes fomentarius]|nr:hypothetical protein C8Q74DRAFT_1222904 [Fomes fomentarius]
MTEVVPETPDALEEQIKCLRDCIRPGPPYCQGTVSVPASDLTLFYGSVENAHRVDFPTATPEQLQLLAESCQPAKFGVNQQDVFDETYRKASKLDAEDFVVRYDPVRSGVLDIVHSELAIDRLVKQDAIRAELYKLNIYGPGSFFKPHVDTPRSELQFGSLVIVFPTAHEGGALKIRYANDTQREAEEPDAQRPEWTFDSGSLLAACTQPSIAYVAFFSDVEHEVLPVLSGHRITITYNLYWTTSSETSANPPTFIPRPISTAEDGLRETTRKLLNDPTFLPDGGHLMFGLSHQYPMAPATEDDAARKALNDVSLRLKANDAVIYKVMQELSLHASLKILYLSKEKYHPGYVYVACDRVIPFDCMGQVEGDVWKSVCLEGGMLLSRPPYYEESYDPPIIPVQWVTKAPQFTHAETKFVAYGNEALIDVVYWSVYLLVRVGPAGDRSGQPRAPVKAEEKIESESEDEDDLSVFE